MAQVSDFDISEYRKKEILKLFPQEVVDKYKQTTR